MKIKMLMFLQIIAVALVSVNAQLTEEQMLQHLEEYDNKTKLLCNAQAKANWAVQTDVGNLTKEAAQAEAILAYSSYRQEQYETIFKNAPSYSNEDITRKLKLLKEVGTAALSADDLRNLTATRTRMSKIYNSAKICPFDNQNCNKTTQGMFLDPNIELALAKSTNYDELQYLWEKWRDESGKLMRDDYKTYIDLYNKAAQLNGYSDAGAMWRGRYEEERLVEIVDELWAEVEPLYNELHTYVRYKLLEIYGDKMDKYDPLIPAHVFGNMWAQNWVHLYERIKPFKNASSVDVTKNMEEMNMTVYKMFELSDEFYMSMGLPTSNMSYTGESVIERIPGVNMACHASAWDFCDGEDFRIKMCTKINQEDFIVVHHEMGHIMYYLLYKDLPLIYRGGANPGFHEAIGDTIALSVSTPKHLEKVGLLSGYQNSEADNINALFHMALERVAFLPFGLLIDKWRWDLFSGATPESEWNKHWWELREKYQKIRAPSPRGEEFFDPGAKYHIPADSQYIAYFVAHILEFSFYKSLCIEAGQYNVSNPSEHPLHTCDFFESKAAGEKLNAGLKLGMSKHWSEALNELTGSPNISASALVEYFAPLKDYLAEQNKIMKNARMAEILQEYEVEGSAMCNKLVKAEWAVATDSNNDALKTEYERIVLENNAFTKDYYEKAFKGEKPEDYNDELIQRQLKYLTKLGRDALEIADLSNLTNTQTRMEKIYNTAKICPFNKQNCNLATEGLTLDPDLSDLLATSTNYDELEWAWTQWREKSGKLMRDDYKIYIELLNEAAKLNGKNDYGEIWRESYEDDKLYENVDKMWDKVEPLYNELHTYVRRKLKKIYGDKMDDKDEMIPAHLLGNMWAQSWINLYERIKPYSGGSSIDITENLKNQNVTVLKMFEMSNDFFMGLGLPNNSMSYDESLGAVIKKPDNKVITCHASAWDFCDGKDFRIKMCTSINQEDFITVHHEMGHINYFILYKDQPLVLRTGANPGFHEAVGDLIALSVSTPKHLEKVGLLSDYKDTEEDNINALFKMALERVAFLPFGLLIDKWRWDLFSGATPESEWNKHWWELREKYQKVRAPSPRNETFFDPGAKYHIPADSQYIAYFIAHILEFQLHRGMCLAAGQYVEGDKTKPLHKCDIDSSKAAGKLIENGLKLGLSKHWSEALKAMTGETEISGEALFDYFKPLYDFLKEENEKDSSMIVHVNVILLLGVLLVKYFL
ncbi:hypothetical protein PVAND_000987 [Polypedilum vanderplanki]|uniref:Angiotensin-converting enzyme n=1 Tax=Polypedilum vanderplanki TaxID=319348 RepID=A0A9J6BLV2_POLVA|nr:hypothetical protein PVAND_000987 [Polypedilum vanderplanki]